MARDRITRQPAGNTDDTVLLPRYRPKRLSSGWRVPFAIAAVVLTAIVAVAVLPGGSHAVRRGQPSNAPGTLPVADETELLATPTDTTRLFRLRPAPSVLVVLFASSHAQALALNRVGAFVEKAGIPHDRVLDDASLDRAVAASGDDFDNFYQGHDYRAADLRRFFARADRDRIVLRPAETLLRAWLSAAGLLSRDAEGAVISVPPASPASGIDAAGRRVILRHEMSHGVFFTDPAFASYVARFWDGVLSAGDRASFVAYLQGQGYDPDNGELMRNECQAYLVFTTDPRYFSAATVGIPQAHLTALRRRFIDGMPPGWLKASIAD